MIRKGTPWIRTRSHFRYAGGSFRVYRRGSSTPIVLLHGGGLDAAPEARALVVSLDSYDLATVERGWRPDEVEQSWHASLSELLLR
jgi:hypothetical protein